MARIKYVINERRLAYEGAVKILESRRQAQVTEVEGEEETRKMEEVLKEQDVVISETYRKSGHAESLAAAGLFAPSAVGASQNTEQS